MQIALCVLDIAGTTVRDNGFVARAFSGAAEGFGLNADPEWVRHRMGVDKRAVFNEMVGLAGKAASLVPDLVSMFELLIEDELDRHPPEPLPGAAASVAALTRAGVKVAFTTGFTKRTAHSVMTRTPWTGFPVVASDEVERGRPAPDLVREAMRRTGVATSAGVAVAGDTPSDLLAGRAAECRVIVGVGHGSHTLDELRPHPHTHLLPDLHGLVEVIRGAV